MALLSFFPYLLEHPQLLLLLPVSGLFCMLIYYRYDDYKIRKIGPRGVRIPEQLPIGLDLMWTSIKASADCNDVWWWEWMFSHIPNSPPRGGELSVGSKEKGSWFREAAPTVEQNFAGRRFLFTADPENIKAMLATQFNDFGKGETFHRDWKPFLGDGIFATDGQQWQDSRALLRPQFIKSRVGDLEVLEHHTRKLLSLMGGQGQELDVSELFYRYSLDTATDFLFGQPINSLDNPESEFAKAFAEVQRIQNIIVRAGPISYLVPKRSYRRSLKVINTFVDHWVSQVLAMPPQELASYATADDGKPPSGKPQTFLHALANFTRSKPTIRDQLVNILLAGRDTTAGTLSFLFYELARHPRIVDKLRHEILARIGTTRAPTYEDIKSLRYLTHTLNETLRLYPAVPYNLRFSLKDTTLPRGGGPDGTLPLGIRKDTPIAYATLHMQRQPVHYPPVSLPDFPDILEFYPERWECWTPKPWTYIPFNGGPRICIGQQFALTQMGYTVVRILQQFERVENFGGGGEVGKGPKMRCEVVMSPGEGVRVGFWDAKEEAMESGKEEKI